MQVGPGLGVVVIRTPFQTKFQPVWLHANGGIELQLLFGVRVEPAKEVGSFLLYPRIGQGCNLKLLGLAGGFTIYASPGSEAIFH